MSAQALARRLDSVGIEEGAFALFLPVNHEPCLEEQQLLGGDNSTN